MVLKAKPWVLLFAGAFLLTCFVSADVEAKKWGVGTFLSYNKPMFSLGDRFSPVSRGSIAMRSDKTPGQDPPAIAGGTRIATVLPRSARREYGRVHPLLIRLLLDARKT